MEFVFILGLFELIILLRLNLMLQRPGNTKGLIDKGLNDFLVLVALNVKDLLVHAVIILLVGLLEEHALQLDLEEV